jgi:5-methylcytosine-specific restriction protein B
MLHEKLAQTLKQTQQRLFSESRLTPLNKLQDYYDTFRERFGPDSLLKLGDEALLTTMHSNGRNSMVYWLEFKNDEEFPSRTFGSIAGGSALKFGVYQNSKTGSWMSRDTSNYPVEISRERAIEIALRHRDQLLRGVTLLDKLPANGSDDDYRFLQRDMDTQAPDVSQVAWGHKYFHMLHPDKLDDFHHRRSVCSGSKRTRPTHEPPCRNP